MNEFTILMIAIALLMLGMIACSRAGYHLGRRRLQRSGESTRVSTGSVDAAVLSLLGLLVAFTFSSAYARYNLRRNLLVDEVNAIATATLRLELLPEQSQVQLKQLFREYLDSRIALWQLLPDRQAALTEYANSERLQKEIWQTAIQATENERQGDARKLLLPVLNDMIDLTTKRLIAVQAHPPWIIAIWLGITALTAAWVIGYGMSKNESPSYLHITVFALIVSLALYVIADLEYLRYGLVTLDTPHEMLIDLKNQL